ncbi:MAG: SGNH/GDSL hydrolase family protein [Cyanobacteria bacterium]|nr:SGNH/GDSL hydrolase family protein [Cyanobacteriota bacterium]MDW8201828.1 SGNH/GDSL hydrolase family protein [Cyanobacteriota bacterium SKYGB_h_bin112]
MSRSSHVMLCCIHWKRLVRRTRHRYWLPILGLILLAIVELVLRISCGLGNPPLLQADIYTGYRFQPNQSLVRFGKRIRYNQYSQRSDPIAVPKPPTIWRILMIGDSVLNGGNPIDQSDTITELLRAMIQATNQPAEVLNASAGSWGIGNGLGYLQLFGTLDSDIVVLQIGAHDLYQPTSTSEKLGRDPNFPNRRPWLALQEVWSRYLWPRLALLLPSVQFRVDSPTVSTSNTTTPEMVAQSNRQLLKTEVALIRQHHRPVYILFVPGFPQVYPPYAPVPYKAEFMQLAQSLQVPVLDLHQQWLTLPASTVMTYFRDELHFTVAGNHAIATALFQLFCQQEDQPECSNIQP